METEKKLNEIAYKYSEHKRINNQNNGFRQNANESFKDGYYKGQADMQAELDRIKAKLTTAQDSFLIIYDYCKGGHKVSESFMADVLKVFGE